MHGEHLPEWARDLPSALDDRMGFELLEISAERVRGRLPVEGNTQPMGLLHGGANAVLVETCGSLGSWAHARESGRVAVGVDLNVTHLRSTTRGWVHAEGVPLRQGRSVSMWQVTVTDEQGRVCAVGRLTCHLVPARPAPPD